MVVTELTPASLHVSHIAQAYADQVKGDLICWKGQFFEWYGDKRWVLLKDRDLEDRFFDGMSVVATDNKGESSSWPPTSHEVREVVRALGSKLARRFETEPAWLKADRPCPADNVVVFEDQTVDIAASARAGSLVTLETGKDFFTLGGLPVRLQEAACPIFDRCMKEWSDGDDTWIESRLRFYARALIGCGLRRWPRGLIECGKPRAGKGLMTNTIMKKLLGKTGYFGAMSNHVVSKHGLDGAEHARLLVIGEAEDLHSRSASDLARLIKNVIGQDDVTIDAKYLRAERMAIRAIPVLQCNELMRLPNSFQSLTGKLVALRFRRSWMGREDNILDLQLEQELPGIARRLLDALIRLWAEPDPQLWFPPTEDGEALIKEMEQVSSDGLREFLEWGFVPSETGFVHNTLIRSLRTDYEREIKEEAPKWPSGKRVSDKDLLGFMESRSMWNLKKRRDDSGRGARGLRGLSMKSTPGAPPTPTHEEPTHDHYPHFEEDHH